MFQLLAMWMPGMTEWIVILVIGLLLFGGRLPEVGKSLGRSIVEFRKGLRGLKDDVGLGELSDIKRDFEEASRPIRGDLYEAESDARRELAAAADVQDAEVVTPQTSQPPAESPAESPAELPAEPPAAKPDDSEKPTAFGYKPC